MLLVWTAAVVGRAAAVGRGPRPDPTQARHHADFPIIGHFRYLLEAIGPELRQYIVTSNDEELPFNRDQRRWVYASSKKQDNYFGFGTDSDLEQSGNYLIIKHSAFPIRSPNPAIPTTTRCTPSPSPRFSADTAAGDAPSDLPRSSTSRR